MSRLEATPFAPGKACGRLVRGPQVPDEPEGAAPRPVVLIIHQRELAALSSVVAGLIVLDGAPFSHPMIRLLGLGVPVAMLPEARLGQLPIGETVVLDADRGELRWPAAPGESRATALPPAPEGLRTGDGVRVSLRASVASTAGAERARRLGAEAIGLVRSEFLAPPDGAEPDAPFYERALRALFAAAAPLPVTVRLIDVAADKRPAWLPPLPGLKGALGLQGARLYALHPVARVLDAQLRALAALQRDVRSIRLLVPYVVLPEDFQGVRERIDRHLGDPVVVGSMAETPATALDIGRWLELADFVAIGCNDLMQCLFAADRDVTEVAAWLDPYAPGLYRILRLIAREAGPRVGELQLCGLLPQLPGVLPLLLGLGYRCFSVEPYLIPALAVATVDVSLAGAEALVEEVLRAPDSRAVRALMAEGRSRR